MKMIFENLCSFNSKSDKSLLLSLLETSFEWDMIRDRLKIKIFQKSEKIHLFDVETVVDWEKSKRIVHRAKQYRVVWTKR